MSNIVKRFLVETLKWKQAGSPVRSEERIKELFEICSSNQCGQYQKANDRMGKCGLCGCSLKDTNAGLNKLAWATTNCPHDPPLWKEEEIQVAKEEVQEEQATIEEPPAPVVHGCGCR